MPASELSEWMELAHLEHKHDAIAAGYSDRAKGLQMADQIVWKGTADLGD